MKYTALVEKTEDGWYVAQCEQISGALTQGRTLEEVEENLKDAIKLCLEYEKEKVQKNMAGRKFVRRTVTVK
jgi:predicted RNase H-like HicB family nuclease